MPSLGSSKPPIMRSVVVLPQPDGPSSAKNLPLSIVERQVVDRDDVVEALRDVLEPDVRSVMRPPRVRAPVRRSACRAAGREGLGRDDVLDRADARRQVEQVRAVRADELDEDVEAAGGDDDVARLLPLRDLVGDRLRRAGRR